MKTRLLSTGAVAAVTAFGALDTSAIPIRLDTAPYISPTTSVPGNPSNQGVGTVRQWLQDLVTEYNLVNEPDLPAVASSPAVDVSTPGSPMSWTVSVLGYLYLTAHWGQGQTDDHTQAWYLGGSLSTFTLTAPGQNGLSGYRLWNEVPVTRVPEAGGTWGLLWPTALGLGLLALGAGSNQRQKRVG